MKNKNDYILIVGVCISILMAGYSIYKSWDIERVDTSEMRSEMFKFADSIAESKMTVLKLQYKGLDSALKYSLVQTANKKQQYEEVKKPSVKLVTTVQLDSFWAKYQP